MTDQNIQNQVVPETPGKKGNPKLSGGFSRWISALTGKAIAKPQAEPPQEAQSPELPTQPQQPDTAQIPTAVESVPDKDSTTDSVDVNQPITEDSVAKDIATFKKFTEGVLGKVSKKVTPVVTKGVQTTTAQTSKVGGKLIDTGFFKKLIKIFFVIVVIMILIFFGLTLFKQTKEDLPIEPQTKLPTPTSLPIVPFKPSVYAQDAEILKLEEEISTLERELAGTNLKESTLNPPILDYNVSF